MSARYLIRTQQGDKGPYTAEQIRALVEQNQLPPTAQIVDMQVTTAAQILSKPAAPAVPAARPAAPAPAPTARPAAPARPVTTAIRKPPAAPAPAPVAPAAASAANPLGIDFDDGFARPAGAPVAVPRPSPAAPALVTGPSVGTVRPTGAIEVAPAPDFGDMGVAVPPPVQTAPAATGTRRLSRTETGSARKSRTNLKRGKGSRRGREREAVAEDEAGTEDGDARPAAGGNRRVLLVVGFVVALVVIGAGIGLAMRGGGGSQHALSVDTIKGPWHVDVPALRQLSWFRQEAEPEQIAKEVAENTVVFFEDGRLQEFRGPEPVTAQPQPFTTALVDGRLIVTVAGGVDKILLERKGPHLIFSRPGRSLPMLEGGAPTYKPPGTAAPVPVPAATPPAAVAATEAATPPASATPAPAATPPAAGTEALPADAAATTSAAKPSNVKLMQEARALVTGTWCADGERITSTPWYNSRINKFVEERASPQVRNRYFARIQATTIEIGDGTWKERIGPKTEVEATWTVTPAADGWFNLLLKTTDGQEVVVRAEEVELDTSKTLMLTWIADGRKLLMKKGEADAEWVGQHQEYEKNPLPAP